ncbi:hypothetical protein HELRODRAFT_162583 [Helobdella robusta]|uniref:Uncharacterized protein n=1 Tax=Helobdella robusta TaxID=6412 RepID=T1ESV7_HELRO|nr:hypothetical protein HELRODRAFT_162583 [Helobdella robusta]ESN99095.1 hypothetical protein HELRODRAFT_162583 [Helobdella robusta]
MSRGMARSFDEVTNKRTFLGNFCNKFHVSINPTCVKMSFLCLNPAWRFGSNIVINNVTFFQANAVLETTVLVIVGRQIIQYTNNGYGVISVKGLKVYSTLPGYALPMFRGTKTRKQRVWKRAKGYITHEYKVRVDDEGKFCKKCKLKLRQRKIITLTKLIPKTLRPLHYKPDSKNTMKPFLLILQR